MIDLNTVLICAALSTMLMALMFTVVSLQVQHRRNFDLMIFCQITMVAGLVMLSLRGHVSDLVSTGFGDSFLMAGCGLLYLTIHKLRDTEGHPVRVAAVVILYSAWVFLLLFLDAPHPLRTLLSSGGVAAFLLVDASAMIRETDKSDRSVNVITASGITVAALAIVWDMNAIALGVSRESTSGGVAPEQIVLAVAGYCASIVSTVGLLMMHWSHSEYLLYLQSTHDGLTGLLNRRAILTRAQRDLMLHARSGLPMCALMMDIDHFKKVNDTYGHQAGDDVLKQFAALVGNVHRQPDLLARYGGEEFIIFLPQTDALGASILAQRIMDAMRRASFVSGAHMLSQTISIGIAEWGASNPVSLEELIARADHALYRAKHNGRDRLEIYQPGEETAAVLQPA